MLHRKRGDVKNFEKFVGKGLTFYTTIWKYYEIN